MTNKADSEDSVEELFTTFQPPKAWATVVLPHHDPEDDPQDHQDPQDPQAPQAPQDPHDPQDTQDPQDPQDPQGHDDEAEDMDHDHGHEDQAEHDHLDGDFDDDDSNDPNNIWHQENDYTIVRHEIFDLAKYGRHYVENQDWTRIR
jgi:hypothetical protein